MFERLIVSVAALEACAVLAACSLGPVDALTSASIAGVEVASGRLVLCSTKVNWDGTYLQVEGFEVSGQAATKKYAIGKINFKPEQIREVNNLALGIDLLFQQMCSSTNSLRTDRAALLEYIRGRDKTAREVIAMIVEVEKSGDIASLRKVVSPASPGDAATSPGPAASAVPPAAKASNART